MKAVYPIEITETEKGYVVYIPDFDAGTQGADMAEAIEMARDAIGLLGIDLEDDKKPLPRPSDASSLTKKENTVITLVDVDFTEYRRQNDMRTVKKNCTLPSWLCYKAEKANINFSQALQQGLKNALHISE